LGGRFDFGTMCKFHQAEPSSGSFVSTLRDRAVQTEACEEGHVQGVLSSNLLFQIRHGTLPGIHIGLAMEMLKWQPTEWKIENENFETWNIETCEKEKEAVARGISACERLRATRCGA
jgi:hypothetical protein